MPGYVRVKPRKLRLLADLVIAAVTSEAALLVGFGAAIGLTFFILTGGWTGFLR